ncbi:hypothetical protein E1B28_012223 [Marasmius oreades]|uniref:EngB-type G domain-containing protein n=1 Tax=Marasmius oreades TaxID=181124 RepID=A0A9P7RS20_9AGAR|nr:uncharacterized protein E1B28_012223 [Marasmius oreades]KAG7088206.1 hypothetical protein E1B28_012223 [Marasmius oreades]
MLYHAGRSIISSVHKRPYSLFLRNASAAELVATVKPQKPLLDETGGSPKTVDYFPKLGGLPEVIVTGRANSGKSTLFNAVLGRKNLIETSKKAGHTRSLDFFRVGNPGKLLLVDAPGYGQRGRPEWGALFDDYVKTRRQLKRILITFNVKNGINSFDAQMIQMLCRNVVDDFTARLTSDPLGPSQSPTPRRSSVQIQPILTKADCLPTNHAEAQKVIDEIKFDIRQAVDQGIRGALGGGEITVVGEISRLMCLTPILTSSIMSPSFGIDGVRRSILEGCGLNGT